MAGVIHGNNAAGNGTIPFKANADGSLNVVSTSSATGSNSNYSTAALAASGVIKATAGVLHSIAITNNKTSAQYIQFHDAASLPADAAIPIFSVLIQAGGFAFFDWPVYGKAFASGIVWCNSSTQATKTIGSADCFVSATYK